MFLFYSTLLWRMKWKIDHLQVLVYKPSLEVLQAIFLDNRSLQYRHFIYRAIKRFDNFAKLRQGGSSHQTVGRDDIRRCNHWHNLILGYTLYKNTIPPHQHVISYPRVLFQEALDSQSTITANMTNILWRFLAKNEAPFCHFQRGGDASSLHLPCSCRLFAMNFYARYVARKVTGFGLLCCASNYPLTPT